MTESTRTDRGREVHAPVFDTEHADDDALRRALEKTWGGKGGVRGFLAETGQKEIAARIIVTALAFFLLGGVEALLMRLQLARPENGLLGPDAYNQLFTVHGTTMMFLFAVPMVQGLGLYFVPLMVGARHVAFPRLHAYSYWVYLTGGLLLYAGLFTNTGPDAGWFMYTPLSGPQFSPGKRVDVWAQVVTFTELGGLAMAVNTIVTIFKHRAPGMSLSRMPLFVWAMLVTSFMVIFSMPAVMLASGFLALDRLVGTHFFNHAEGGDHLLWQHLFWFFAHPEVYIIFLPATGIVSMVVGTFSRRPVFGYTAITLALVANGFVGFGLWVHHMFTTGLAQIGQGMFTSASMLIAIPSGVQIFCWIATLATGRVVVRVPLLFVLGFVAVFVMGGLSGVMLASVPLDTQVHDTYFVVAHLHYVLIGGAVFPILGGLYYWFPKFTGRVPSERVGRLAFWVVFVGFNLTFFPLHKLGLEGMPRRVYTYGAETGWSALSLLATVGAFVLAAGVLLYLANLAWSRARGAPAGDNPWHAESLEWGTASPPPAYNFLRPPTVRSREPLWEASPAPVVSGLRTDEPETLATTLLDADPDYRHVLPPAGYVPFVLALATALGFVGLIFTTWAVPAGAAIGACALIAWFWPRPPHHELAREQP